jgi:hypothetical protein
MIAVDVLIDVIIVVQWWAALVCQGVAKICMIWKKL